MYCHLAITHTKAKMCKHECVPLCVYVCMLVYILVHFYVYIHQCIYVLHFQGILNHCMIARRFLLNWLQYFNGSLILLSLLYIAFIGCVKYLQLKLFTNFRFSFKQRILLIRVLVLSSSQCVAPIRIPDIKLSVIAMS